MAFEHRIWQHLTLPGQNDHYFAEDICRYIFVSEKFCISIQISLTYIPEGPIFNNLTLV